MKLHANSVFRILHDSVPGQNLLFSPLAAAPLLALLLLGTKGEAQAAIRTFFSLSDEDAEVLLFRLAADLKRLREGLEESDYQISSAFWYHGQRLQLHPDFLSWFEEVFEVQVRSENFRRDTGAQDRLDDWCVLVTRGQVARLPFPSRPMWVPSGQPFPLFLGASALHLKARWQTPFDTYCFETDFFTCADGTKRELFFMVRDHEAGGSDLAYFKHAYFHGIQIPFAGGRLVMEIFLPHVAEGLTDLMRAYDFSQTAPWADHFAPCPHIYVLLPIFETGMRVPLTYGNLGKAFAALLRPGHDFDLLFEKKEAEEHLGLSDLMQAVHLRVDLEGVNVPAVPARFTPEPTLEMPLPAEGGVFFEADHPFLYRIRDLETGQVLLLGTFCQPSAVADWPRPITDRERRGRLSYRKYLRSRHAVVAMAYKDLLAWALEILQEGIRRFRLTAPTWLEWVGLLETGEVNALLDWGAFWKVMEPVAFAPLTTGTARETLLRELLTQFQAESSPYAERERFMRQALRAPAILRISFWLRALWLGIDAESAEAIRMQNGKAILREAYAAEIVM